MVSFSVYYGIALVGDRGFEPPRLKALWFKHRTSANFVNHLKYLVSPTGIEPVTLFLEGICSDPIELWRGRIQFDKSL